MDLREIAIQSMRDMAEKEGFPLVMREEQRDEYTVFVGTAPDGREFSVAYDRTLV